MLSASSLSCSSLSDSISLRRAACSYIVVAHFPETHKVLEFSFTSEVIGRVFKVMR